MKLTNRLLRVSTMSVLLVLPLTLLLSLQSVNCFNLSPKPNVVIRDPQLATALPKVQSSYFGFSLNLRPLGLIVGAPRAQSTLEQQRNVNETGAIYRCSLSNSTCFPYVIDKSGNTNGEPNDYTYNAAKRDYQWLGGSIDGGVSDTDKLLVCAPRFINKSPGDYLLHGICYWVNDTLNPSEPINVKEISPLRLKTDQIKEGTNGRYYYYMLSQQGISAHVTDNNEEFIMGAPGIYNWKGSVVRYHRKILTDDPSLSRRDTATAQARSREKRQSRNENALQQFTYESQIPNPKNWDQQNDSYFGYSVGSGYFDSADKQKLLFVASAPQANENTGEAYLFEFAGDSIKKYFVFRGEKFGEFFGYAILTEDLNGDGLTDVIVSAPQHSTTGSSDEGAIYVFINQGRFNFERRMIAAPLIGSARFGTTLSRLGDINHDGFKDIAVSAPFANNGSVFIYLGSQNGLRMQYSQRLSSPLTGPVKYERHMFGHGLSKGVDIDGNGFNDFAIGAPNVESVFLYRAYPVIKVQTSISSQTRQITPDQNKFKVNVCYGISTTSSKIASQELTLRVVLDAQVQRVKISGTQTNEMIFNVSATNQQQCRTFDCDVRYSVADIFKPIDLEVHYQLVNDVPDSEIFCDKCAAVDPAEPKIVREKIIFSTGCASEICVADLQLKSSGFSNTFILGSSRSLSITYEVYNGGENAYLPQINITSSNNLPFARIPPNCKVNHDVIMICDLNSGQPLAKGAKTSLNVLYDVSSLTGKSMVLTAQVFSTGKESNAANNIVKDAITLSEYTEVHAQGVPATAHLNLEKDSGIAEVINNYEIRSLGPSIVNAMEVIFYIPIALAGSGSSIPIINMNNITMQAVYDAQLVNIEFYQNNTLIIMNPTETSSKQARQTQSQNGFHYDTVKMGYFEENQQTFDSESVTTASMTRRSRRSRREVIAHETIRSQYMRSHHTKSYELLGEEMQGKLPVNRTIIFNCNDPGMTVCLRAEMRVYNYKPEKPITVNMKYQVDLNKINEILIEPWEFFVVLIGLNVKKIGTTILDKSLVLNKQIEYNIISKHQLYSTPLWIIILAILGGLILLAAMTYGMYKAGFFKRATRDEMTHLASQHNTADDEPTETENLNSER